MRKKSFTSTRPPFPSGFPNHPCILRLGRDSSQPGHSLSAHSPPSFSPYIFTSGPLLFNFFSFLTTLVTHYQSTTRQFSFLSIIQEGPKILVEDHHQSNSQQSSEESFLWRNCHSLGWISLKLVIKETCTDKSDTLDHTPSTEPS